MYYAGLLGYKEQGISGTSRAPKPPTAIDISMKKINKEGVSCNDNAVEIVISDYRYWLS